MWPIHLHPREFPDPDVFRPSRYLTENRIPYPNERGYNTFGFGRRQCSGQPLAEQGLFISLARLLWAFNIRAGLNEKVRALMTLSDGRERGFLSIFSRILTGRILDHNHLLRDLFRGMRLFSR